MPVNHLTIPNRRLSPLRPPPQPYTPPQALPLAGIGAHYADLAFHSEQCLLHIHQIHHDAAATLTSENAPRPQLAPADCRPAQVDLCTINDAQPPQQMPNDPQMDRVLTHQRDPRRSLIDQNKDRTIQQLIERLVHEDTQRPNGHDDKIHGELRKPDAYYNGTLPIVERAVPMPQVSDGTSSADTDVSSEEKGLAAQAVEARAPKPSLPAADSSITCIDANSSDNASRTATAPPSQSPASTKSNCEQFAALSHTCKGDLITPAESCAKAYASDAEAQVDADYDREVRATGTAECGRSGDSTAPIAATVASVAPLMVPGEVDERAAADNKTGSPDRRAARMKALKRLSGDDGFAILVRKDDTDIVCVEFPSLTATTTYRQIGSKFLADHNLKLALLEGLVRRMRVINKHTEEMKKRNQLRSVRTLRGRTVWWHECDVIDLV